MAWSAGVVTVSVGVAAQRPSDGGDGSGLVAAADRALHAAKGRGHSRTCVADGDDVKGVWT
jgi:PleD family two-component response regulator